MAKHTYRVVTRARDGSLRIRDFDSEEPLLKIHIKVGVDDCSTDLSLRGKPVFRGLVGPMPDGQGVARYESPEVFETLTREWIRAPTKRRRRRSSKTAVEKAEVAEQPERESAATAKELSDWGSEQESAKILPMTPVIASDSSTDSPEAVDAAVGPQADQAEVADETCHATLEASETRAESAGESKAAERAAESELQEGAGSKVEGQAAEGREAGGSRSELGELSPAPSAPAKEASEAAKQNDQAAAGEPDGEPSGRTTRKTKSGTKVKASQQKGTSKSSTIVTCGKP